MQPSGFVLAGGGSSRMGKDKALLSYQGMTLVEHVARIVAEAAGSVALIGDPERYGGFGYPVYPDYVSGCGPLGGLFTALRISRTDWNVVVGCDMPGITAEVLRILLDRAAGSDRICVVAASAAGDAHPLCAVYHRACLPVVERAIADKRLKMKDLLQELEAWPETVDAGALLNVNTPAEWAELELHAG